MWIVSNPEIIILVKIIDIRISTLIKINSKETGMINFYSDWVTHSVTRNIENVNYLSTLMIESLFWEFQLTQNNRANVGIKWEIMYYPYYKNLFEALILSTK